MHILKIMFIWIYYSSECTIFHSCTDKDFAGVAKPWECRFGSDIRQSERSRTVTVNLDESEYVVVTSGDIIGWHVPSGDVIDYKTTNIETSVYMAAGSMSDLHTGMNYTFSGRQESGRIYGIKVLLSSVPPQRLKNPPHKLTLKCPLEADEYITTIEAFKESFVRYNIDGYNPWFSINELTGDVKTITLISGNLSSDIQIVATSICDVQTSLVLNFQCIEVAEQMDKQKSLNFNRPPVLTAPELVSVPEDTPGGTALFTVSTTDWDTDDRPNISIVCISHSTAYYFSVQSGTVKLQENASLNYEVAPVFTFQAQADDGHTTSAATYITMQVTDVNEPPVSHESILLIQAKEGKASDCVSSTDIRSLFSDPENDTLTYSILKKNDTDWFPLMIDTVTGFLYLSQDVSVTRKTASLVLLAWVMAEDPGKLSAQTEVKVTFTFVNSKPVLPGLPVHITMFENWYVRDVYTVAAADEDGDSVTLRYHSLDEVANTLVFVNTSSGEIKIMTWPPLSQGQQVFISLIFTAHDGEDSSGPGLLNITIVGINDPPRFPKEEYRIIINETQVGQIIASQETWIVNDPDPDDRLTFFLKGATDEDSVLVNSATGEMAIREFYDIDVDGSNSSLIVWLMVMDSHGLNSSAKVIINITDVNDNIPVVENNGEVFVVPPDITPGWRVGQIKATDSDSGKNSKLTYSIMGTSLNTTSFLINPKDGWILFSGLVTAQDYVTISCTVSDNGQPPHSVTAVVHVVIAPPPSSSLNKTVIESDLLQHFNSFSADHRKDPVTFILTGLVVCSVLVIFTLSYQLWKMKKTLRMTEPEQSHDAHHDYRFQWVPRQIVEEGHDQDTQQSASSLGAIPSFLRTSVSNQNFHYEPAVLSQSQELQEPVHQNEATETSKSD